MSGIPTPWPRQIADAILLRLNGIKADSSAYLVQPAYVGRIFDADSYAADLPALLVQIGPEKPTGEIVSNDRIESTIDITVNVITQHPDAPDDEMHDMVADVKRALLADAQLGLGGLNDGSGAAVRECVYLGYDPVSSLVSTTGKAVGKVNFRVLYAWSRTQP